MTDIKRRLFSQFDGSDERCLTTTHNQREREREGMEDINVYKRPNLANETKHDHNLV